MKRILAKQIDISADRPKTRLNLCQATNVGKGSLSIV